MRLQPRQGPAHHGVAGPSELPFPPPGRYALELTTRAEGCLGGSIGLRRIALRGANVVIGAASDAVDPVLGEAARDAIGDHADRALEHLGERVDHAADRVRLVALDRLGAQGEADAVFTRLAADLSWNRILRVLLRQAPGTNAARAQHALGPAWPTTAWSSVIGSGWTPGLCGSTPSRRGW